jgi:hypothetical protein
MPRVLEALLDAHLRGRVNDNVDTVARSRGPGGIPDVHVRHEWLVPINRWFPDVQPMDLMLAFEFF